GHFGRRSISIAWYGLVFPSLVINYFGQGARLIGAGSEADAVAASPFFALVPTGPMTWALVAVSTVATVIASQARIPAAYSRPQPASQLGSLPRLKVTHTSTDTEGQIYVGAVNWALAIACIALVLGFRESSRLAGAYGIAVTGTMAITSIIFFVVTRR